MITGMEWKEFLKREMNEPTWEHDYRLLSRIVVSTIVKEADHKTATEIKEEIRDMWEGIEESLKEKGAMEKSLSFDGPERDEVIFEGLYPLLVNELKNNLRHAIEWAIPKENTSKITTYKQLLNNLNNLDRNSIKRIHLEYISRAYLK